MTLNTSALAAAAATAGSYSLLVELGLNHIVSHG